MLYLNNFKIILEYLKTKIKMKKTILCNKYRKFKNSKIWYIFKKYHTFLMQHYFFLLLVKSVAVMQIHIEILQLRAKFQTAMVSCSRFIWMKNFNEHTRGFELEISCIRSSYLTQVTRLGHYFVCKRFAIQILLW